LSFKPELANRIGFWELLKMRIAGDGLNYLTPSATMAGEIAKTAMLGPAHALEERVSSVAVSKITQLAAMLLCSVVGLGSAFLWGMNLTGMKRQIIGGGWLLLALLLFIAAMEWRAGRSADSNGTQTGPRKTLREKLKAVDASMKTYLRAYPARTLLSTLAFFGAYVWGTIEAYLICYFLGHPVTATTALLIELLSVFMDAIFFAVPAKAGTQEATKTAIFAALGLNPAIGFAFGITRHIREIAWAAFGLWLYYRHCSDKKRPGISPA
ncbi:MAG TPA: lysylphosphatidylglycerol synthase domain-containing protein, partial [Elusimicrobiales bacterium]|nr:lysylphosphatidylglycerol synthase domain-containing protein [Elusimicrobiales bacterium]